MLRKLGKPAEADARLPAFHEVTAKERPAIGGSAARDPASINAVFAHERSGPA